MAESVEGLQSNLQVLSDVLSRWDLKVNWKLEIHSSMDVTPILEVIPNTVCNKRHKRQVI